VWLPPIVTGFDRNLVCVGRGVLVHEPVVHHELNPRRGHQIENRRRDELVTGHQLAADDTRIRHQQVGRIGKRVLERDVAAEAATRRAHLGIGEVVVRAVDGARLANGGIQVRGDLLLLERRFFCVVQVLFAQLVADVDQFSHRRESRPLEPFTIAEEPACFRRRTRHRSTRLRCRCGIGERLRLKHRHDLLDHLFA
jgi:hypothetical protein